MAAVTAGLVMLAFAFAAGTRTTHGQTPGATGTVVGTVTAAATTPAGTPTTAVGTATTPAGTPTRGALTPSPAAASPTAALPTTGTGPDSGNSMALWVAGAGIMLAIFGGTFVLTGVRRR
jgi:hypothetical protein